MSMSQMAKQRSANAVGGKTARSCDSCLRCRARWYCAADDAFLCQACDSSVHSANPLARRHDRVRLKTTSYSPPPPSELNSNLPAWHQGFKRKARTPRHGKPTAVPATLNPVLLVPDLEMLAAHEKVEVGEEEEEEEQLLYRVPIFDPVLSEFCSPPTFDDANITPSIEEKPVMNHGNFAGFDPSDIELADQFAADVENLLGQSLDNDSFCIDGLGLLEAGENDRRQVKTEMMDAIDTSHEIISSSCNNNVNFLMDVEMEFSRESLDFNFDYGSPATGDEVEEQKVETVEDCQERRVKIGLRLDYDAVIDAWSLHGCSPWAGGERPQLEPDDCWPDFMGMWGTIGGGGEIQGHCGLRIGQVANGDGGREARVSRYREKRRTRLFSKKIRYEVRKLNAEKRPRMKGRFVKRTSFPATSTAAGGGSAHA